MRTFAYKSSLMALIVTALREIGEGNVTEAQMAVIQDQLKNIPAEEFTHDLSLAPQWVRKQLTGSAAPPCPSEPSWRNSSSCTKNSPNPRPTSAWTACPATSTISAKWPIPPSQTMQESMVYEESPSFEQLIDKLPALNERITALNY